MNKQLNCKQVSKMLSVLPLQEIDPRDRLRIEEHLTLCSKCRLLGNRMAKLDRMLALMATEPPSLRRSHKVGFAGSRLRFAGYLGGFVLAATLGAGFGVKYGVNRLFGEAFAADLPGAVQGLRNLGFDDGQFSGGNDWTVEYKGDRQGVPNFYELDGDTTYKGKGRSLKLYLRSYGGSVFRNVEGPFPAGTLVKLRARVLMPNPGSTNNKYLSFGVGGTPSNPQQTRTWSTSIDVFDASPQWKPYTMSSSLPVECSGIDFSFGTGAGDGNYVGWDRAAWIDDVQIAISVPIKGTSTASGDRVIVRLTLPKNFTLENPRDLMLWTYGNKLPLLPPITVEHVGNDLLCTYEAMGLGKLVAAGNPDNGQPGLPIKIVARLRRGGLVLEGTCGSYVLPGARP